MSLAVAGRVSESVTCVLLAFCALAVVILLPMFCVKRKKPWLYAALAVLAVAAGLAEGCLYQRHIRQDYICYDGQTVAAEGIVLSRKYSRDYLTTLEVRLVAIGDKKINVKVILRSPYRSDLQRGYRFRTTLTLSDFSEPGDREYRAYYRCRGFYLVATDEAPDYDVIEEKAVSLSFFFADVRDRLSAVFAEYLSADAASFVDALFLGDRSGLPDTVKRDFKRDGIYHLLAVSGTHLSLLAGMAELFLRRLRIRKSFRCVILAGLVIGYTCLTGMNLSTVRSAVMLLCGYAAFLLAVDKDSFTSLAFAVAGICAVSPRSVFDVGFGMSVAATFGIIVFTPLTEQVIKWLGRIPNRPVRRVLSAVVSGLLVSCFATCFTLPFTWYSFGILSRVGVFVTLLSMPLVSILLTVSPLLLLIYAIPFLRTTALMRLLAAVINATSHVFLKLSETISKGRHITLSLSYSFVPIILAVTFILLLPLLLLRLKHKWLLPLVLVLSVTALFVGYEVVLHSHEMTLTYTVRKENEYWSLQTEGVRAVIDVSDGSYSHLAEVIEESESYGFGETEVLVLTHVHQKHKTSVSRLLRQYRIRTLWLPEPLNETERNLVLDLSDIGAENGVPVVIYRNESLLTLFGAESFTVKRGYLKRSTHPVIGLDFTGHIGVSYFGSSYGEVWQTSSPHPSLILGTHGPVAKQVIGLPLPERPLSLLCLTDENARCLLLPPAPGLVTEETTILEHPERVQFKVYVE